MGKRLLLLFMSLTVSLALAEGLATLAAGGAYPYLNLFRPDPELGVALSPERTTRIRSRSGRITSIATDATGRRIHPVGEGETILLLGDSQTFGYHVQAEDALASQLAALTGARVVDAAVPSYGPHEYATLAERLVPELNPTAVVVVLNLANDWWEVNVQNRRRSAAQDGWLKTRSGKDDSTTDFPGRAFLMGRSHLVLATRTVAAHATAKAPNPTPARLLRDRDQLKANRFLPYLLRIKATGAKVLVVALPIDVMVDDGEWAKYRTDPADVDALDALLTEVLTLAAERELSTLNLLPVLEAASPGAFLDDDPHLSPQGHRAFAEAVAAALTARPEDA